MKREEMTCEKVILEDKEGNKLFMFQCVKCDDYVPVVIKTKQTAMDHIIQLEDHFDITKDDMEEHNEYLREVNGV